MHWSASQLPMHSSASESIKVQVALTNLSHLSGEYFQGLASASIHQFVNSSLKSSLLSPISIIGNSFDKPPRRVINGKSLLFNGKFL